MNGLPTTTLIQSIVAIVFGVLGVIFSLIGLVGGIIGIGLVGAAAGFPVAMAPLAASHSPGPVFLDGAISNRIVWEALGGIGQQQALRDALSGVVLCANDPVAAWGGARLLRDEYDIEPLVVTGPATDNAVGVDQIRQRLGLTQKAFAGQLGVSLPYLNQMENNNRPVSTTVVLALAITAALTVAFFIYSAPVYELESQLVRGQP